MCGLTFVFVFCIICNILGTGCVMDIVKVDLNEFLSNKDFYYEQIPKAQNSDPKYKDSVFDYYIEALKSYENSFLMTAQEQGQVIGCALFRYYEKEDKFFVLNVNTRKDCQHTSKKVATNVLLAGMNEFFNSGSELNLWVAKTNLVAQKLYSKLGFEINEGYYPKKLDFLKGGEEIETMMIISKDRYKTLYQNKDEKVLTN